MPILDVSDEELIELTKLVSMQLQAAKLVTEEAAREPSPIYPGTARVKLLAGLWDKLLAKAG